MEKSELTPDFKDFLKCLNERRVDYLVVGGFAVIAHGYVRTTMDLDVWIAIRPDNASRFESAMIDFIGQSPPHERLLSENMLFRMGHPPTRIEVMTTISGVDFKTCHDRRLIVEVDGVSIPILALADLRKNKAASGRLKDLADLENLPPA